MPSNSSLSAVDWLALSLVPKLGPRRLRMLMSRGASWWDHLSVSQQHYLDYLRQGQGRETVIQPWLAWCEDGDPQGYGRAVLYPGHPEWPALLDQIEDPPPVLWAWGNLQALTLPMLAVVGTRQPTSYARVQATRFAHGFAEAGVGVVSGLALGVDACAHQGALKANGTTVAVLGGGVDVLYPRRHANLRTRLLDAGGLLLSEHPPGSEVRPVHFPRRNRIITGLSHGVVVVEAASQSGSLVSARLALEQNRDVFAIPGMIDNPQAEGCHALIQQGAMLVTSPEAVLGELTLSLAHPSVSAECIAPTGEVLAHLSSIPCALDALLARTGLNMAEGMAELLRLEMAGQVQAVAGGWRRYQDDEVSP